MRRVCTADRETPRDRRRSAPTGARLPVFSTTASRAAHRAHRRSRPRHRRIRRWGAWRCRCAHCDHAGGPSSRRTPPAGPRIRPPRSRSRRPHRRRRSSRCSRCAHQAHRRDRRNSARTAGRPRRSADHTRRCCGSRRPNATQVVGRRPHESRARVDSANYRDRGPSRSIAPCRSRRPQRAIHTGFFPADRQSAAPEPVPSDRLPRRRSPEQSSPRPAPSSCRR